MTKDNIMKLTDGLFRQVFEEISLEYLDIQTEHMIIDIGAARIADTPERFDVIVTSNLYGDIISDIAAQIAGSVGLAGSANIGEHGALFEAIHGSAPDIAGKDLANPSGLLQAAVQMLVHLNLPETAARVQNAWLTTLEEGVHTGDIFNAETSQECVGTRAFADAVIARLGRTPKILPEANFAETRKPSEKQVAQATMPSSPAIKALVGVDVFFHWRGTSPEDLALRVQKLAPASLPLAMITNRGVKVWPGGQPETFCTDHWRCRFLAREGRTTWHSDILGLLAALDMADLDFIKTEHLYEFDGVPGFALGQGQ